MTFCLDSIVIKPEKELPVKNVIILLHGYGGSGKDISTLSLNWKRYLQNTIFLCPNAHETCSINSKGFQWFDLTKDDPQYVLKEVKKAEKILNQFIEEVKEKFKIQNNDIFLCGFSQGCMMSINIGLTAKEKFNSIVGFSGKIIDQDDLKKRKNNSTDVLLFHGDQDDVVSPTFLLEAKDFLLRNDISVITHLIKSCGHNIPIEASSLALNYILKKIK
jgi:phospholipase/carboxylesterase